MKISRPSDIELRDNECVDRFMDGRLTLIQSKDGYRFSIDAVLLSEFARVRRTDTVIDLGTGCGVMLLALILTRPFKHGFGLEIQEDLASQAARNAVINGVDHLMDVVRGDIRNPPFEPGSADVVLCNPPYRRMKSGRINPDPRRAVARHEILATLDDILAASAAILRKKGRLALIYPASRLAPLLKSLIAWGLEPKRLRVGYPSLSSPAKLILVEACRGGKPSLSIEPPFIGQGNFSLSDPA